MPSPEALPPGDDPVDRAGARHDDDAANTDLLRLVAAAADLCRKPLRHGVVPLVEAPGPAAQQRELTLRLEARSPAGERCPEQDLELEIYPSGADLNLTLAWCQDEERPMLWQGNHPVWMDANGTRCPSPDEGAPLEALARRLRALLVPGQRLNPAQDVDLR